MKISPEREWAMRVAMNYLGQPYIWGGDDPTGFDCSGLVIEALQSVGAFPVGRDATADGLRKTYPVTAVDNLFPGDLVFWLREGKAFHVGMILDPIWLYIGAEGGGSWASDPAEALKRNAFVKVRPVASRGLETTRVYANPYG